MNRYSRYPIFLAAVLSLLLVTAINSPIANAEGGGKVTITTPQDNAMVSGTFTLKWDLDKGSQGAHSHLYIDGENKGVIRSTSHEIAGLAAGKHTIEVRLASKDHSELGPKASVNVMVH